MTLSDDAYKRFVNKHYNKEWVSADAVPVMSETASPLKGAFIYRPHDCDLPDPWETPLGSIWVCYGHREGRMCYDQWICTDERGSKRWVIFQRNMRG